MSLKNVGDTVSLFGYTNKLVASNINKTNTRKERIVRVYNENRNVMDKNKIVDYVKSAMAKKRQNQSVMLRIFTDAGWRTIKQLNNDSINWQDEEEYLSMTKNPEARPYKQVFFLDYHAFDNM